MVSLRPLPAQDLVLATAIDLEQSLISQHLPAHSLAPCHLAPPLTSYLVSVTCSKFWLLDVLPHCLTNQPVQ